MKTATKTLNRSVVDSIKSARQCESDICLVEGIVLAPYQLDFDHLNPATKYTTKSGKREEFSDMVKRYALATILAEIEKCRVLCKLCHATHSHNQRNG